MHKLIKQLNIASFWYHAVMFDTNPKLLWPAVERQFLRAQAE